MTAMTRTAVVVGGSGDIGSAAARRLVGSGVGRMVLTYSADRAAAEEAAGAVRELGCDVTTLQLDATDDGSLQGLATAITQELSGGVDVLVYAAAVRTLASALEHDDGDWDRSIAVGVKGFLRTIEVVTPAMPEGGRIVAISGLSGLSAYSTQHVRMGVTKAALQHAVRYVALELAPRHITANTVVFGAVRTAGVAADLDASQYREFIDGAADRIPMGRVPEPDDVVGLVGFLATTEAGWITGQVLVVDGGETVR